MRWGPGLFALGVSLYLSCHPQEKTAPSPHYVGDAVCQRCHAAIAQAYAATWKARSLLPVTPDLPRIEDFQQPPVYDPHRDFYYRARWEGDSLYLYEYRLRGSDTVYLRRERLDFVVGSGHQTRSYLLWRNGFLYEAPLTWYVRARKWDLSPGYHGGRNSRFDREIAPACLACHAQGTQPVAWTYNRYEQVGGPLGCESCHGPGSAHVQNPTDTLYHWSRWPKARQMDVCSRCHLEGFTVEKRSGWKPGDTLAAFYAVFLPHRPELGQAGIASHAERLLRSACYQKGGLTCATCHAPHPVGAVPSYDQRCLSCHTAGCANPTHPRTGCPTCHMPKGATSDIPHTQFTDHYIRVVGASAPRDTALSLRLLCATEAAPDSACVAEAYFRWYVEGEGGKEVGALAERLLERWGPPLVLAQLYLWTGRPDKALPYAEQALARDTTLRTLETLGYALEGVGQGKRALAVWGELARRAPAHPDAPFRQAILGYQQGYLSPAQAYRWLDSLCAVQPWNPQYHYNAAVLALQLSQHAQAQRHLSAALSVDPDYPPALALKRTLALRR
ncbi:MAG: hypothetical protein KatS3mg026_1874 [Bacteroidia bacterium]|nr:MAG: hypothetical protein KatS3mg026_1874 [Bacteroidia bacterium]